MVIVKVVIQRPVRKYLHESVDFADIGTRCIDDRNLNCVVLIAPEISLGPEEDGDVLMGGTRIDYLFVISILQASVMGPGKIWQTYRC